MQFRVSRAPRWGHSGWVGGGKEHGRPCTRGRRAWLSRGHLPRKNIGGSFSAHRDASDCERSAGLVAGKNRWVAKAVCSRVSSAVQREDRDGTHRPSRARLLARAASPWRVTHVRRYVGTYVRERARARAHGVVTAALDSTCYPYSGITDPSHRRPVSIRRPPNYSRASLLHMIPQPVPQQHTAARSPCTFPS